MQEFESTRDCVITGHPGIARKGDRIALSPRAAKYPRLKGWIEPAPGAEDAAAPAQAPPAAQAPAPRRRRQAKK